MRFGILCDSQVIAFRRKMCGGCYYKFLSGQCMLKVLRQAYSDHLRHGSAARLSFRPLWSVHFPEYIRVKASWCSVLLLWRGKFNPYQLCNAMQRTTSCIFRCAPPFPWLSSCSEGVMHSKVFATNECCAFETMALHAAAEGYWLIIRFVVWRKPPCSVKRGTTLSGISG